MMRGDAAVVHAGLPAAWAHAPAVLPGTLLPGTLLPGTVLAGAALPGTVLPGTVLAGTVLPGTVLAGAGLVAAATVAGAWLARRRTGQRQIWFAAAAGALLIIAGLHLLPDAWAEAGDARIWPGLVPVAAIAGFTAAGLATRAGCACHEHREQASGGGAAAALTVHRFLEGSAIAL